MRKSCTNIYKWSDQIFVYRHHQTALVAQVMMKALITIYAGDAAFQTGGHEIWSSNMQRRTFISAWLSKDCCTSCCLPYHYSSSSMDCAQPLWCTSITLYLTAFLLVCLVLRVTQKSLTSVRCNQPQHPEWNTFIEKLSHFKPHQYPSIRSAKNIFQVFVLGFLLSWLHKINPHTIWVYQKKKKKDFGWLF